MRALPAWVGEVDEEEQDASMDLHGSRVVQHMAYFAMCHALRHRFRQAEPRHTNND
jgi:hypothetical protein